MRITKSELVYIKTYRFSIYSEKKKIELSKITDQFKSIIFNKNNFFFVFNH
jgi:hypothetical protein